jgi:choline dehydrogenase
MAPSAGAGYINMNIGFDGSRAARRVIPATKPRSYQSHLALEHASDARPFDGDRASGVSCYRDVSQTVGAEREVIVAAGTIHSAKLLMLSGVGDAAELCKLKSYPPQIYAASENQPTTSVAGVVFRYKGKAIDRPAMMELKRRSICPVD